MFPPPPDSAPPALVAHADWSVSPTRRWLAVARLDADGGYTLDAPQLFGAPLARLHALRAAADGGGVLLGLDFPLGLPLAYAQRAGIADFAAWLPQFGDGRWADVGNVATAAHEINLTRPFYPHRPGGTRRADLLAGLGLVTADELLRWCDRATTRRRAAAPLFWTLGAQQVGKGALAGWRELVQPALAAGTLAAALWPFDGRLAPLLARQAFVLAEAYPGEYYHQLGIALTGSKRSVAARRQAAGPLAMWAEAAGVRLTPPLLALLAAGCGDDPAGEDRFDAIVGACGCLNVVLRRQPAAPALPPAVRQIEGWILGQHEMPAALLAQVTRMAAHVVTIDTL